MQNISRGMSQTMVSGRQRRNSEVHYHIQTGFEYCWMNWGLTNKHSTEQRAHKEDTDATSHFAFEWKAESDSPF